MSKVKIDIEVVNRQAINSVKQFSQQSEALLRRTGKSIETVRENVRQLRNTAAVGLAAITAGFVFAAKEAAQFETGLLGVAKTVNDLSEKELVELGKELVNISKRTPFATQELLELAKSAGQLGVTGKDNIILFTETIAKLGTAANISGEEAATSLARILNVTNESTENIDNLSSAIVDLGNNFAASESEIVEAGKGIAQATSQFGVSSAEAVSFGAAVKALGIQSELSRSVFLRSFDAIRKAIQEGGSSFARLEQITGLTGDTLRKEFDQNASSVFRKFLGGLGDIDKAGGNVTDTLEEFGLKGIRVNAVLPVLAKRVDVVNSALDRGSKAFRENTALQKEYDKQANSLENTMQRLQNVLDSVQREIGERLEPVIRAAVGAIEYLVELWEQTSDEFKNFVVINGLVVAGLLALVTIVGTLVVLFYNLTLAAAALNIALAPFLLIPVGIALISAAIIALIVNFENITNAVKDFATAIGILEEESAVFPELRDEIDETTKSLKKATLSLEDFKKKKEDLAAVTGGSVDTFKDLNTQLDEYVKNIDTSLKALGKLQTAQEAFNEQRAFARINKQLDKEDKLRDELNKKEIDRAALLRQFKITNAKEFIKAKRDADRAEIESELTRVDENHALFSEEQRLRLDTLKATLGQEAAEKQLARELERENRLMDLEEQQRLYREGSEQRKIIDEEIAALKLEQRVGDQELRKAEAAEIARQEKGRLETFKSTQDAQVEWTRKTEKEKLEAVQTGLSATEGLMKAKSRELFEVGKAAATANAVINTYASAVAAYNAMAGIPFVGPALAVAAAAGAIAAGLSNVERIQSQQPGFEQGGIVPGSSFSGDNVSVGVNSGEMILNREQQGRLFNMANGQGGNGGQEIVINNKVELDGEVIFNSVSRQVADGRELGEVV